MIQMFDAQRALSFLVSQLTYIEPEVYTVQYSEIRYPALVPIDTSAPEWIPSVTYFYLDGVGQAKWVNGGAQDVPHAENLRGKFETGVAMGGIGYSYTLEELGQAEFLRIPLTAEKGIIARRVSEEFIDKVVIFGDTIKGYGGLANNSTVTAGSVAANGTGSSTLWANKTYTQINADINAVLTGIYTGTNKVMIADTLLLPIGAWTMMANTQYGTSGNLTLLEWVRMYNIYTATTRQPLNIEAIVGLDTAGAGGTGRMVAYKKDPLVLKFHMPMPYKFLPAWQTGPMKFEVPGIMRLGGLDIKQPGAVRYADGMV